ncbi:MAG: nitrile hydratase accessory protein [Pseudomonadota bacterium]
MDSDFDIGSLSGLPLEEDEPVFDAPWQAKAFAMCVTLHEQGLFTWPEWAERLGQNIRKYEIKRNIEGSDDYYSIWQTTLEQLVDERA